MRMLADLPDIGLSIGFRHPIPGFDFDFTINFILEYFFQILHWHR
jgi:hypothetical protein